MDKVRAETDHVLVLNGGDNVSGKNDKEWLRQSYFLMDILTEIGMDAVALQGTDMRMGIEDLKAYEKEGLPLICANLFDEDDNAPFPGWKTFQLGNEKVGVLSVTDKTAQRGGFMPEGYYWGEIDVAIEKGIAELKAENCDQIVLLFGGRRNNAVAAAEALIGVDLIYYGNSSSSLKTPIITDDGARVLVAGNRGKDFGEITLTRLADGSMDYSKFTIHELDGVYPHDEPLQNRVDAFLAEAGERKKREKLIKELARKQSENESTEAFTGTDACKRCHIREYDIWASHPHAHAMVSLEDEFEENNPECIGCHVTGWEQPGGYGMDQRNNQMLASVQCEACHGYGTQHDRTGSILTEAKNSCTRCHDQKFSPDFDFEKYWARIEH